MRASSRSMASGRIRTTAGARMSAQQRTRAHCFGGLVVLKALLEARYDADEWSGILDSTTGLLFFGTPFRGAEGISQMEMLEAARREYHEDEVQTDVLKVLEPGNEFLQEIVDQFSKMRKQANRAEVACFYELKSSNVGKIVGKQDRTVEIRGERELRLPRPIR
ncbi:hypothetical protein GRF29_8g2366315 [Pseudopithomyces chartarum]|uniref:Uncharacterized protein n=1 Tax=Pseudopithomyces chartarum TaxID=1892770 RepID=A0AAN6RLH6_9PLEO|nr:hypothetical protein GRF29_8g2366315 [Pseudopithomyces chartarum]